MTALVVGVLVAVAFGALVAVLAGPVVLHRHMSVGTTPHMDGRYEVCGCGAERATAGRWRRRPENSLNN